MNFNIKELVGVRCIIKDDGQKVFDAIHDPLKNGETVTLDFLDVRQFASPFFNFAIGQLLKDIKEENLRKLLKIKNLDQAGQYIVELVIKNASQSLENTDYQKIVDDILEQQANDPDL